MSNECLVLVGTDFSSASIPALKLAELLARKNNSCRIHLVHVVQVSAWVIPPLVGSYDFVEDARGRAEAQMERLALRYPELDLTTEIRVGVPAEELAKAAEIRSAEYIVVGTHGRTGLARAVLGSVASGLIRVAKVPVFVVPEGCKPDRLQHVMAGIDLSEVSTEVVRHADKVAADHRGETQVVSLFEHPLVEYDPDDLLPSYFDEEAMQRWSTEQKAKVEGLINTLNLKAPTQVEVMSKMPPWRVLVDLASLSEVDLLVVGTSGHNAWHRMIIGSTATNVVLNARCPVLVVPNSFVRVEESEPLLEVSHAS